MYKGRALVAPCMVVTIWVAARSASLMQFDVSIPEFRAAEAAHISEDESSPPDYRTRLPDTKPATLPFQPVAAEAVYRPQNTSPQVAARPSPQETRFLHSAETNEAGAGKRRASVSGVGRGRVISIRPVTKTVKPMPDADAPQTQTSRRLSLYGYAFWRDSGDAGLAPAAQYGGSQIGVIASLRLGKAETAPSFFGRVSSEPESLRQAELAAGLRWQPLAKLPVSLSFERRFRRSTSDAFAAYFSGGWSSDQLPLGARLSLYGQAGLVRTDQGTQKLGHFYDGNIRLDRKIVSAGKASLSIGGGAWAGGQRGVNRVDAGPSAIVDFGLARTSFRLSADYRFRAAGNARPKSGPAITLTASY